jgi:hypothetical protein
MLERSAVAVTPTITPEPIAPTRTPAPPRETDPPTEEATLPPPPTEMAVTDTPEVVAAEPTFTATADLPESTVIESDLDRFGVSVASVLTQAEDAHAAGLPFGSILNWNVVPEPPGEPFEFWQMVRVEEAGIRHTDWETIAQTIDANPASYWMVGNEPDVQWQDNVTPQRYAEIYHEVYTYIKERDPEAKLVIGGVSQSTPLRRAYLDIVLDTYEATYGTPMPIDVWNIHAFTLREEVDSWGVGIPPGMEGTQGILYELEDHDNVEILAQNVRDFRKWMAVRGYGDKPLVVSEYGILMPEDYGFPPETVIAFLEGSFDFFLTTTGEDGYAPDGNRLVQWWFWYSVYDPDLYPTGNLWDVDNEQLTEVGQAWSRYVNAEVLSP